MGALAGIDRNEIQKILEQDKKIEVKCRFCGKIYNFTSEDFIKE